MKKLALLLLFCLLLPAQLTAQLVSRNYRDCPMPQVLADLSRTTKSQRIVFIYNDLEDYVVTQQFDSLTLADAIRACIGFYPISLTSRGDSILLVECTQKTPYRLTGRLVDERGLPVSYANITLFSVTDSAILNKGVSNQSGRFVIPTDAAEVLVRVSHVAYKTLNHHYPSADVGIIRMEADVERLDSVSVTPQPVSRAETEYYHHAQQVTHKVWAMQLPHFDVDTLPAKYKDAPAVVLADYDSIAYFQMRPSQDDSFLRKPTRGAGWPQTLHLHRTRYLINTQEAADELSHIVYSLQTDITNLILYRQTVMGIRITKSDGTRRTIDTFRYFKPRAHSAQEPSTDTIHIVGLQAGDILDVFLYHRYRELLSPYSFRLSSRWPVVSYEARAVAGRGVSMSYEEASGMPNGLYLTDDDRRTLSYWLHDYNPPSRQTAPRCELHARPASRHQK